jgi:hypothetical protein
MNAVDPSLYSPADARNAPVRAGLFTRRLIAEAQLWRNFDEKRGISQPLFPPPSLR